ncbi:urease accessory protein UreD [Streptomyces litchfieldiae]|uniref:Urease accessory protein UreD n=1 Tax=Streptomyces litchfieldiae TaxID=3075543 RepID=A0ABU2MW25_9ACTN|nr:urease accessory protein UreD [Streptomyces sp. DSM 44938]MDT0345508.1 urease accessory protein UreD [Streptomyces sp. DSM 44938]
MTAGVTGHARITAAPGGALPVLRGGGPLALRRTRAAGPYAQVTIVGAMSGPLGGDRLRLTAEVEPGAALRVTSAAATLALPGRAPAGPATYDTALAVGEDAELRWLPEPLISVRGSDLRMTTRVELAATARLVLREQQVLGRAGEEPGSLTARLVVRRAGRPLLDQEFACGPGAPGWDGGAVLGGHRALGQLLVVDPELADKPAESTPLGDTAVLTPLAGPAALVTAVAPDALALRRLLDQGAEVLNLSR